jgi:hypothetical protein
VPVLGNLPRSVESQDGVQAREEESEENRLAP